MKSGFLSAAALAFIFAATPAIAHEGGKPDSKEETGGHAGSMPATHGHSGAMPMEGHGEPMAIGHMGDPAHVSRTVNVDMNDTFRFAPAMLKVRAGETLHLVFHNSGAVLHEWILGTAHEIEEHAELMRRFPNMEHDEPQQVRVPPGESRELVWRFERPGTLEFACLQPGHYEAGMKGLVEVK